MLSSINAFFSSKSETLKDKTFFETHSWTKPFIDAMKELESKTIQLKKLADKKKGESIEHQKYKILSLCLTKFKITLHYQSEYKYAGKGHELLAILVILKELHDYFSQIFNTYESTLIIARDDNLERATKTLKIMYFGIAIGAFIMTPIITTTLLVTHQIATSQQDDEPYVAYPKSYVILKDIIALLDVLIKGLLNHLNHDKFPNIPENFVLDKENMFDPLTGEVITHAFKCSLDHMNYNKLTITKELKKNGKSPLNNREMLYGQTISDVLTENTELNQFLLKLKEHKFKKISLEFESKNDAPGSRL